MENAADALKIAFAIFVLITGITITFSLVSQAKSTADFILFHADETNFYEHLSSGGTSRTVSVAEVISNLHKYYNESIGITIIIDEETYTFDLNNREYYVDEGKDDIGGEKQFDRQENVEKFISNKLLVLPDETLFEEEFVEVPISGIYEFGEDDTELVLSAGGKKVYITYREHVKS